MFHLTVPTVCQLYLVLSVHGSEHSGMFQEYYVTPDPDICPPELVVCITLQQYASTYFTSDTIFYFLDGSHHKHFCTRGTCRKLIQPQLLGYQLILL